jgi:MFS family permease
MPSAGPLRHKPFQLYLAAQIASAYTSQIGTVAIGWQVYQLTNSAFDLGLAGLVQFLPTAVLTLAAGHAADRFDRRRVVRLCRLAEATVALFLAAGSLGGWFTGAMGVGQIFAALTVLGVAGAFESPASSALLPAVAPAGMLQRANALGTASFEVAVISGPALGGLAYAVSPALPYALMVGCSLLSAVLLGMVRVTATVAAEEAPTLGTLFAGIRFVRDNPALLGSMALDMLAVLLGGATALMPIYARDILHTGPWGLGILRAAPAVGALLMTAVLSQRAIETKVGVRLFQSVILFGLGTMVFALSHAMWLSLLALAVMGAADMVSMVIRASLEQIVTPEPMRGRVGAVVFLFINASNQLGEFESGIAAALLGAVPAVFLGGMGTVLVALVCMRVFPALRQIERLE